MSGALPPAGLPGDAFPPPPNPAPPPAPPLLRPLCSNPAEICLSLRGRSGAQGQRHCWGLGPLLPFLPLLPLLVGGGVIKPGSPGRGGGISQWWGGAVSGCHINVCRRRRAAAPIPASQEPHRESPHCAPWPAWGERLPQGSSILRPGSPSPTSQRSFETWISLEPLPPLSQALPERKWGPLGPLATAMLSS